MIDPTTALTFSMAENKRVYALLLGSGVSRAADIPTGWEIIVELTRRLAAAEGAQAEDPLAWHRERFGGEPSYSTLLDLLTTTPAERRSLLHGFIEPTPEEFEQGKKVATKAHKAIAKLVRDGFIRVIITTNFDRLMENALREVGVEATVISSEDGVAGMTPLIHCPCLIVKVHGDYLDTRIRNTDQELAEYTPALNGLLDRIFDEHGLIVCGWSGEWDLALRNAIERAPSRRYPMVWASRGEPTGLAADLMARRAGRWVQISNADDFFDTLQQKVEIQADLARPHPLSIELLAAMAKRYVAEPATRVQLGDLVLNQTRTALDKIAAADISGQTHKSASDGEEFQRRVTAFEAHAEPLTRLFAVLGRWGDGSEAGLARDGLVEMHTHPTQNGLVLWNALRSYPAVWLWYAYGLGATKAGRLDVVYRWLSQPFPDPYRGGEVPAVRQLFLHEYQGSTEGDWKSRHPEAKAPDVFSNYLRAKLSPLLAREFMSRADFDRSFERFELMASLRHAEETAPKAWLEQASAQAQPLMSPIGRMEGGLMRAPPLVEDFKRPANLTLLAQAGFMQGDEAWVSLALDGVSRSFSRFRF